jgi:hypothetical protein
METSLLTFKKNGGWCWFQDERALVIDGRLIFGSVAGTTRDGAEAGDVEVSSYDLSTGEMHTFKLHPRLQSDDHNTAAFLALPDGRILAAYQSHGGRIADGGVDIIRWRTTTHPGDIREWTEEKSINVGAGVSYSNLYRLEAENGRIYNFHRGIGFNPNYLISDDNGETFRYGGRLLSWPRPTRDDPKFTGMDGGRPYVRYISNGRDTIHVFMTEDHPRAYDNSVYHAFIREGRLYQSNGTEIGPLSTTTETPIKPNDFTCVFSGDQDNVAWCADIRLDRDGHPVVAFSVQKDSGSVRENGSQGGEDHRYHYGRWDGSQWHVHEIAYAGSFLFPREQDYTGLISIAPDRPEVVYISTNADPVSGKPLISAADGKRHWEIFRGETADFGAIWTWTPLTADSTADNLRPIIRAVDGNRRIVLWLRGTYTHYVNYDLDVVGYLETDG